ncbi:MAG: 3-isopropylmalate dehydratase large subunit [Chloroflexi bacterium]|nr:3-isopropylmalate dehydratase large subunit [Chloroflexota bacterium]
MTLAEKILAAHSGKAGVNPGDFLSVRTDLVLSNDITAPIAIREFERLGVSTVFDPEKIVMVPDHFCPNKDIQSAEQAKMMRDFARKHRLVYFEVGEMGIEHVILPEKGLVLPGEVVVGADSHTCTYGALGAFATGMGSTDIAIAMATGEIWMKVPPTIKFVFHGKPRKWVGGKDLILYLIGDIGVDGALYSVLEFHGEAVEKLGMDSRFTMSNMAIESGGKAGLFHVDGKTRSYLKGRTSRKYTEYRPDPDAAYARVIEYDTTKIEPQVAFPHLPSNTRPVSQAGAITIDQVVIGSCTNGRMDDLRIAASVLKGRKVDSHLRLIILPGSQQVYLDALKEGLIEIFIRAGAAVSTPTCGPCLGGYMGILAAGERCVSTTNRNFVGRMGHVKSEVYLANPAVAAASAIAGRIAGPEEIK